MDDEGWPVTLLPATLVAAGTLGVVAAAPTPAAAARPAHHGCRPARGQRVWTRSARAVVYADGPFANPDTHNTRVVACWRPSGRRTLIGYDYRFDDDDPTSRFALLRLAGPWLAVDQVRVNQYATTGMAPIPLVAVFDLRRGRTLYCAAPPPGDVLGALAVSSAGSTAWILDGAAGSATAANSAVQAYDRDGLRTLQAGLRGRFSKLALSVSTATWRDGPGLASGPVAGPPRPASCPPQ